MFGDRIGEMDKSRERGRARGASGIKVANEVLEGWQIGGGDPEKGVDKILRHEDGSNEERHSRDESDEEARGAAMMQTSVCEEPCKAERY